MGLFGKKEETVEPAPAPPQEKHGSLFNRRSSPPASSPTTASRTSTSPSRASKIGNMLGRDKEDKSVTAARERVLRAEDAEQRAERALAEARAEVKEAKEHARRLEAEAAEDLKRAQKKTEASHDISKRANPLGRFGN